MRAVLMILQRRFHLLGCFSYGGEAPSPSNRSPVVPIFFSVLEKQLASVERMCPLWAAAYFAALAARRTDAAHLATELLAERGVYGL